ncbi:UUP1 family membrane protein [Desulfosediminicola ganghwensis]|uniref:UUP1 family membrane protein n=1 Tax=Desulfosediminicola ganghwensis TaxID=2569540 RepID=UPI0010AD6C6E|nr:UUP1 family membrane protein [Desulfosediminicola ganghwensis]
MKQRLQLIIIVTTLVVVGLSSAIYKHYSLGFSFLPSESIRTWTVESAITFTANDGPVEMIFNLPNTSDNIAVLDMSSIDSGYTFELMENQAKWSREQAKGAQKIFFRATVSSLKGGQDLVPSSFKPYARELKEPATTAANNIIAEVEKRLENRTNSPLIKSETIKSETITKAIYLLTALNNTESPDTNVLISEAKFFPTKANLAATVLNKAGIKARPVRGINLVRDQNNASLDTYIEIVDNNKLVLLNPTTAQPESRETFLSWQIDDEPLLDLIGGSGGKVAISILGGRMAAERAAVLHGHQSGSVLIDFSIYSLPIKDQNTFKLLLLIPIGALVVVVLRNLIGIPTSGTFMPILIALVFLQTKLIAGLVLFITVVGVGLVLRSYLSHLNLLLVPRISAVLVFVIIIYVAISVGSHKLGIAGGMQVTFFPMIIISWTIERMSVLWEEEGPRDVFKQGGGSLFAASLIYFAMSNSYLKHLTFSFPELLLVVLAIIIMIGSYSGYRLTELRRFEPLARGE